MGVAIFNAVAGRHPSCVAATHRPARLSRHSHDSLTEVRIECRRYMAPEVHLSLRRGSNTLGALWFNSEVALSRGSGLRSADRYVCA